jgi:hypothetical protein
MHNRNAHTLNSSNSSKSSAAHHSDSSILSSSAVLRRLNSLFQTDRRSLAVLELHVLLARLLELDVDVRGSDFEDE